MLEWSKGGKSHPYERVQTRKSTKPRQFYGDFFFRMKQAHYHRWCPTSCTGSIWSSSYGFAASRLKAITGACIGKFKQQQTHITHSCRKQQFAPYRVIVFWFMGSFGDESLRMKITDQNQIGPDTRGPFPLHIDKPLPKLQGLKTKWLSWATFSIFFSAGAAYLLRRWPAYVGVLKWSSMV